MPPLKIMPSLLASDKGHMADECRRCALAGADGIHIDIMDGHFVPNLSMGPEFVSMTRDTVSLHRSVHLMVTRPDLLAELFIDAGSDTLLLQVESDCDISATLAHIRRQGIRPGLVLNPDTPLGAAEEHEGEFDELLCMTVHPGFGGQAFLPHVLDKIRQARAKWPTLDISVDGGIDGDTAARCSDAGASTLISGTFLFSATDMVGMIHEMRSR